MSSDNWDWPDQLTGMWDQAEERFRDDDARADFIEDAEQLFYLGFLAGGSTDERQGYRDDFFALMEENDISIDVFDWDDWRDWYEGA